MEVGAEGEAEVDQKIDKKYIKLLSGEGWVSVVLSVDNTAIHSFNMNKKWIAFLREFAKWIGCNTEAKINLFLSEQIDYAIRGRVYNILDDMMGVEELRDKVEHFKRKYNL